MPNTSTVYAMYLRKSRADLDAEARGEGETLRRHETILSALARKNHHPIGEVYREIVSGETIDARPEMRRLLADVAAGRWAGVYVTEVERLARGDTSDQGTVSKTFLFSATKIVTLQKTYDPTNEFDEEYFEFSLFMSRREYKTINRRIQAGRMQSDREGRFISSRPAYGYRKAKIQGDKGYTLVVEPTEAEVVRYIFDTYTHADIGLRRIAGELSRRGAPTGQYGSVWNECRVYRILTNEVYIGKIRWGHDKQIKEMIGSAVQKKRTIQRDYMLCDGLHDPIVNDETFAEAQRKLHIPRVIPVNDGRKSNPLSGLIVCGECGYFLRAKPASGRQPARIHCHTRGCPTIGTYRDDVERAVLDTLRAWLADSCLNDEGEPSAPSAQSLAEQLIAKLHADRDRATQQIEKLYDLVERGTYTDQQFNDRFSVLSARISEIDRQIAAQEQERATTYIPIHQLSPKIATLLDAYDESSPAERNQLLKSCISKVVYRKSVKGKNTFGHITASDNQFSITVYPRLLYLDT